MTHPALDFVHSWVADHPPPEPESFDFRSYLDQLVAAAEAKGLKLTASPPERNLEAANQTEGSGTREASPGEGEIEKYNIVIPFMNIVIPVVVAARISHRANDN